MLSYFTNSRKVAIEALFSTQFTKTYITSFVESALITKPVCCLHHKGFTVLKLKISPIFVQVSTGATIFLPRLFAGFYLALFLFIHVVKLTHHHNPVQPSLNGFSKNALSNSSDCSICSYEVAKDSHHFHGFVSVLKTGEYSTVCVFYNRPLVTSRGSAFSGRGPPLFS